jgi:pimeloyl-ACP methyl ester carboxylesterase
MAGAKLASHRAAAERFIERSVDRFLGGPGVRGVKAGAPPQPDAAWRNGAAHRLIPGPIADPAGNSGVTIIRLVTVSGNFTRSHRGGSGSPLLLLHGFTDTWRTWELVLPALERRHDVLAPTLAGHAGGPPMNGDVDSTTLADAVERAMDEAGFETAHVAGNSLGGYVALQLAERGRARTVVALAPAGGWAQGDRSPRQTRAFFEEMQQLLKASAPHAETIVSTADGRRRATLYTTCNFEHIPAELLAHQMRGAANCPGFEPLNELAQREGWPLDPARVACPIRIVWGIDDRVLPWPSAAARYRDGWFPNADWVELEGVGHCSQLDVPAEVEQLILGFTS